MPPKAKVQKVLPDFPEATSEFKFNQGFRPGMSDVPPLYNKKPVPKGKPDCLAGIAFVVTGTLPSLTREDFKALIEKYGGRVSSSISGRTDVLVRGCLEVGPAKLQKAKDLNIKIVDEDGLFAVIQASNPDYKPPPLPKSEIEVLSEKVEPLSTEYFPISDTLTEKYRPRKCTDLIGNGSSVDFFIDSLNKTFQVESTSVQLSLVHLALENLRLLDLLLKCVTIVSLNITHQMCDHRRLLIQVLTNYLQHPKPLTSNQTKKF